MLMSPCVVVGQSNSAAAPNNNRGTPSSLDADVLLSAAKEIESQLQLQDEMNAPPAQGMKTLIKNTPAEKQFSSAADALHSFIETSSSQTTSASSSLVSMDVEKHLSDIEADLNNLFQDPNQIKKEQPAPVMLETNSKKKSARYRRMHQRRHRNNNINNNNINNPNNDIIALESTSRIRPAEESLGYGFAPPNMNENSQSSSNNNNNNNIWSQLGLNAPSQRSTNNNNNGVDIGQILLAVKSVQEQEQASRLAQTVAAILKQSSQQQHQQQQQREQQPLFNVGPVYSASPASIMQPLRGERMERSPGNGFAP
jgi:hypothetical protein